MTIATKPVDTTLGTRQRELLYLLLYTAVGYDANCGTNTRLRNLIGTEGHPRGRAIARTWDEAFEAEETLDEVLSSIADLHARLAGPAITWISELSEPRLEAMFDGEALVKVLPRIFKQAGIFKRYQD